LALWSEAIGAIMRFHQTPILLFLFMIGVLPGFAQNRGASRPIYNIDGYVRDDRDQRPLENVRVDLRLGSGIPFTTAFTRSNGDFQFTGLSSGSYIVEVVLQDYETARETVSVYNSSVEGVTLSMVRPFKLLSAAGESTISAHQLSVPHKAHEEFDKGMMLFYQKADYRGAIAQFDRAIKDFPTYYEAYEQEGNAHIRLTEMVPAEEALRKSVELSSGQYSEALLDLSGLLSATERYTEAATFARSAIGIDSSTWRGPFELAMALEGLKQIPEAEKSAIQARDMKPDNPPVYLMLANIHIHLNNLSALSKDLDSYIKLVPAGPLSDRARKTRDQLQVDIQQEQNKSAATQEPSHLDAQTSAVANVEPASGNDTPPPPEPDTSGLTSLPPPTQSIQ
jgi:tetratricopeptide (TPR) repeat protein